VRYETPVERVEAAGGRATSVRTASGERLPCEAVVLNVDLPTAYRDLLPAEAAPRRVARLRYSPSCVVVHLGLDRAPVGAAHHNIHFARDYRGGFDDVLAGRPQRDPSWFLSVPTVTDATLAPPGGAVAYQLVPCPNLATAQVGWDPGAEHDAAQARMEAAGYGPIRGATVVSHVTTPRDWADAGMAGGTPFAASHHFFQSGPFRPSNVAPKVDGVYFAGSGTTPGVGVPMVLVSGKLAAERVLAAHAPRPRAQAVAR
jgi:phytoene desaturase